MSTAPRYMINAAMKEMKPMMVFVYHFFPLYRPLYHEAKPFIALKNKERQRLVKPFPSFETLLIVGIYNSLFRLSHSD